MNYQLIISKRRKTIGLQVKNGDIIIRAPAGVRKEFIDQVVQEKSAWLKSKVDEQLTRPKVVEAEKFVDGGIVYLWGKPHRITANFLYKFNKKQAVSHSQPLQQNDNIQHQLLIATPYALSDSSPEHLSHYIKKTLEKHFKNLAENYLDENLDNFVHITNLKPTAYQVKKYKARWGSCNSRKELSFNYLLVMTPPWVIDYVIIHELCHIKHLNHSPAFWHLVDSFYPNYKSAKQWLKTHNQYLQWG